MQIDNYDYDLDEQKQQLEDERFIVELHLFVKTLPVPTKESNAKYAEKMKFLDDIHNDLRKKYRHFKPLYIHEEKETFPYGKYCDTVYSVVSGRTEREI